MSRQRRPDVLTPREREVLKFVRTGLTNEEIAHSLGITVAGVKYHVSEILSKLGVTSREEMASWREDGGRWYGKLAWVGGASVGAVALAAVAALIADNGRDITLESDDAAANATTGPEFPTPMGRASQLVSQSAPRTASPLREPPTDSGQSARGPSLPAAGTGGVVLPSPTPTPTQTAAPAPSDADVPSLPPIPTASAIPTPAPAPTLVPAPKPQAPRLSLDMDPTGNSYSDPGAGGDNSMALGPIDNCLSTAAPGNDLAHTHQVDVIIENVPDLVGWQARLNYDGGKMRPQNVNFTPFRDTLRGQNVSFQNLPVDASTDTHRDLTSPMNIPPPSPGPQTALIGSAYGGPHSYALSPDTPPKSAPDDSSYGAPRGGVVARVTVRVEAGNAGAPSLFLNLDDGSPNLPGSSVVVFNGSGITTTYLGPEALGDGYHGEGAACVPLDCMTQECALRPAGQSSHTANAHGANK
jgi:DNA-binding CsgD family transcriptional regulator